VEPPPVSRTPSPLPSRSASPPPAPLGGLDAGAAAALSFEQRTGIAVGVSAGIVLLLVAAGLLLLGQRRRRAARARAAKLPPAAPPLPPSRSAAPAPPAGEGAAEAEGRLPSPSANPLRRENSQASTPAQVPLRVGRGRGGGGGGGGGGAPSPLALPAAAATTQFNPLLARARGFGDVLPAPAAGSAGAREWFEQDNPMITRRRPGPLPPQSSPAPANFFPHNRAALERKKSGMVVRAPPKR